MKVGGYIDELYTDEEAVYDCGDTFVLVNHVSGDKPVYSKNLRGLIRWLLRDKMESVRYRMSSVEAQIRDCLEELRDPNLSEERKERRRRWLKELEEELEYLRALEDALQQGRVTVIDEDDNEIEIDIR